jgi:hypothetical protein
VPPDRIGVHYDLARLVKVLTIFDMVDLVDQVEEEISDEEARLVNREESISDPIELGFLTDGQ